MSIPIPYHITREELDLLSKRCEDGLHNLNKIVLEGLQPPAGAYAFFNHNSHALSRLGDIKKITHRLFDEVRELAILHVKEQKSIPPNWPAGTPYDKSVQLIMQKSGENNGLAQLDMESLYIFGQILLDQWSLVAIAIGNIHLKRVHPFPELVFYFEDNPNNTLELIWTRYREKILWLHYQVRFYRNRFIVHANRPWQRGTTRTSIGEEFALFTPTPPGWLDDEKLDREIRELIHLTPSRIKDAPEDYWEKRSGRIIEVLFENIAKIERREDREKIAELFGKKGGSTPTFQVIVKALLEFFAESMETLNEIAKDNLENIDLGKPNKTSDEMWRDRVE